MNGNILRFSEHVWYISYKFLGQHTILFEEAEEHMGTVKEILLRQEGFIFRNFTPEEGCMFDFLAAPTRTFVEQVPPSHDI